MGRVALLPGDPGRVPLIARHLDGARPLASHREYIAYGGKAGGEEVTVLSTGIGGPSAAIAVEELARLGVKVMVRVGTCGAISPAVRVGSLVIADAAVRMEGTSSQYIGPGYPAAATPGVVMALAEAASALGARSAVGIAASTDAFYPGQGRKAYGGYLPRGSERIVEDLKAANVLCFEMEAATLFTLGRIFGLKTGGVMAVVGSRVTDELRLEAGVEEAARVAVEAVKLFKKYSV